MAYKLDGLFEVELLIEATSPMLTHNSLAGSFVYPKRFNMLMAKQI